MIPIHLGILNGCSECRRFDQKKYQGLASHSSLDL